MKKLICAKEVETALKEGNKVIYVDCDTIVTPSAKDAAKANGVVFSTEQPAPAAAPAPDACCEAAVVKACDGEIDSNMIYNVLKTLMEKGLLQGVFENAASNQPYIAERDSNGLKVVRGNSVKYEVLDTGNPADKVFYQEIINADDGCSMNAGFITIETCNFEWECACQELYHIVEGTLTVNVDGKVYTANPGDSVFFPKGAKVIFGSPNKMKAFYATY